MKHYLIDIILSHVFSPFIFSLCLLYLYQSICTYVCYLCIYVYVYLPWNVYFVYLVPSTVIPTSGGDTISWLLLASSSFCGHCPHATCGCERRWQGRCMGKAKLEIKFAADTDFQKQLFLQFDMFLIDFVSFRLCFFRQFNIAKAALHRDCLGAWADAGRNPFQRMFLGHSTVWEGAVAGTTSRPLPACPPHTLSHVSSSLSSSCARLVFYAPHVPKLS